MFIRHRRGRPRKTGRRFANGNRDLSERPFPGKTAVYVVEFADGIVKIGLAGRKRTAGRTDLLFLDG